MGFMDDFKASLEPMLRDGISDDSGLGSDYNKIVQLEVEGDKNFYTEITNGKTLTPTEGQYKKPDITIISDIDTMTEIKTGDLNSMAAFMQGRIKIKGDMIALVSLQKIIFPQPEA